MGVALVACSDKAQQAAEAGALAEAYFQGGNLPEARRAIAEALQHRDDIVDLHLLRGRIEFAAGDPQAAFAAYYNALALDPLNSEALQAVSQLGISTGNIADAENATDRILAISPADPNALLVKGIISLARRRFEEASRYADQVLAARPDDEHARVLKARSLFLQGRRAEALGVVGGELGDGPITESVAMTRLEIFRQIGDAAGMQREFTRLRNLRPADSALRIDEANFLFKRGQPQQASALLVRTLNQTDEENAQGNVTTAAVAQQVVGLWHQYGHDGMAPADWRSVAQTAPPAAREIVARYLVNVRALDAAQEMIGSLDGGTQEAIAARLQIARGNTQEGLANAAAVLQRDATQCDALIAASEAQLALGGVKRAVQAGQQAVAECPDRPEAYLAAAFAYDAFERPAGADRIFGDAVKANPQNIELASAYSRWLIAKGREREAVAILRRYTRNTPASLRGWQLYGDVCRRTNHACVRDAEVGRNRAASMYGVDLPPGQLQPNGLFGRFIER